MNENYIWKIGIWDQWSVGRALFNRMESILQGKWHKKMICLPNTTYEKEENVTKRFLEPLMENGFLKL